MSADFDRAKAAARRFVETCLFSASVDAALLCGSHACGNADEFSDVDVYIVLADVDWRERGNCEIDGMLVEYFANPRRQILHYIDAGIVSPTGNLATVNMLNNGIVLLDRNGAVDFLREYCRDRLADGLPPLSPEQTVLAKYQLWDTFDELDKARRQERPDLQAQCHRFILMAVERYSRYICSPLPAFGAWYRWLTDGAFFANYGYPPYGDGHFAVLVRRYLEAGEAELFPLARETHDYVLEKMGGFDITGYTLRTPCEV